MNEFKIMPVRIAEIKCRNICRLLIPDRQGLRNTRHKADVRVSHAGVGLIHIGNDNRDMLKPAIVAARIGRIRPPYRRFILREIQALAAEGKVRGLGMQCWLGIRY